jgi:hypothetical protein
VTAPTADKSARFASAESMRWLEWGMSSYHAYAFGLALIAFAVGVWIMHSSAFPRAIAYLIGLSGTAYVARAGSLGRTASTLRLRYSSSRHGFSAWRG